LNALLLLRKLTEWDEYPHIQEYGEDASIAKSKLKVFFNISGKKAILNAVIQADTDKNNNDVVINYSSKWYMKDFTRSTKRLKIPLHRSRYYHSVGVYPLKFRPFRGYYKFMTIPESERRLLASGERAVLKVKNFVSDMRYYGASQFTNPGNCPVSFEIEKEESRSRILRLYGHTKFLSDLYSEYKKESHGYQQFLDIIGPNGMGLIDDIDFKDIVISFVDYKVKSGGRIKKMRRERMLIIPKFTVGKHKLSPNQLSEGTFKTITLLFYLMTEASSLLLIEEPEVCVHHGLLSSIIELIKTYSRKKQIVLSTHSDFVLDRVRPENVYKVSSTPEKGTKITHISKSMSKRELAALKKYLESEGNLGEYWKHGALET
jgi:hypothetical protein